MNNKQELYENIMSKLAEVVKTSLNEKWEPTCETELGKLMELLEKYTTSLRFEINLDKPRPYSGGYNVESFEQFYKRMEADINDEHMWNSWKKNFFDAFFIWQKESKERMQKFNEKLNKIEELTNKLGQELSKQGLYK